MTATKELQLFIEPSRAGTYFTLPFDMPAETESLQLTCLYQRFATSQADAGHGTFTGREEINVIDLGLIAPDGSQAGASGSNKTEIFLSETRATPGYRPRPLAPGAWQILVGAYRIAPAGVNVTYELTFNPKSLRLFKGDLHAHTLASDGVHTVGELAAKALRGKLDFLAITDHNQFVTRDALPQLPDLTLIPGVEWTHYRGHANFLGSEQPYDEPFFANTDEEVLARFTSAHERGAVITINHPFEECCAFKFDWNLLPFNCLEVWNGPMRESNLKAVGLWQSLLAAGKNVPISGGSDYHYDTPFIFLGGPTTCVYAQSSAPGDILAALKQGNAFISYAPNGPTLDLRAGEAIMGETVDWSQERELHITAEGLQHGDVVRVVTAAGSTPVFEAPADGRLETTYRMQAPGFARIEILRSFLPGLPLLPALLSNPIYFEA